MTMVPGISAPAGPAASTSLTTATFILSSNEPDATFQCRLDSLDPLAFIDCSSPQTYTALGVGPHILEVRAVDAEVVEEAPPPDAKPYDVFICHAHDDKDEVVDEVVRPAPRFRPGRRDNAASGSEETLIMFERGGRAGANRLARVVEPAFGVVPVEPMIQEVRDRAGGATLALIIGQDDADF